MDSSPEKGSPVTSDQDTTAAVRDLAASIKQLESLISEEKDRRDPRRVRETARQNDPILKALHEEIKNGPLKEIPGWTRVELMSEEEIDAEDHAHYEKYIDFWKEYNPKEPESILIDRQIKKNAYEQAFELFPEIYRSLGWHKNDDIIFNQEALSQYCDTLLEALFAIEPYRLKRLWGPIEKSRFTFEYSRLPRLLLILVRLEARRNDALECRNGLCVDCRYFDADQTLKVLIEVGRTLHLVGFKGQNEMSLQELLDRCYARRILSQPDGDNPDLLKYQFHLIYDCLDALDFKSCFREIRDPLTLTFYLIHKTEPIHRIFEMVRSHISAMNGSEPFEELPLEESPSPTFSPETVSLQYLQDFGGLNIEWTDCLDDHLKIFTRRNAIRIFALPTSFYNCQDLLQERDYVSPIYLELSQTYALLFRPSSRRGRRKLQKATMCPEITFLGRKIQIGEDRVYQNKRTFDINPAKSAMKRILENFHRCSIPPIIQATFNIASPSLNIKDISFSQNKVTSTPMREIHPRAPYYPEDIAFMITSIFQHDFHRDEPFLHYEYFGPRLRRLKTFLDNRQPKTLKELWVDRRDARAWWIFWGSAFFLSMFMVLLAVSVGLLAIHIQMH